jgi:hypothetical protein
MHSTCHASRAVRLTGALICISLIAACALFGGPANAGPAVTVEKLDGRVRVEIDGQLFTEYVWADTPRPYLYPIVGPGGEGMTRNFPMKDAPGEEHDHPHHRSLWFTHGEVNGHDFWTEREGAGKIVHDELVEATAADGKAVIKASNKWIADDGTLVMTDSRTVTISTEGEDRIIDYAIAMKASAGPVHMGDTKEAAMAVRTHPNLRLTPARQGAPAEVFGQAVNSEGVEGKPVWGKRAKWVDYWGPIDGNVVGIAIFDTPTNPRYPTWWMARDYGLVAADPFGAHAFDPENQPEHAGDLSLKDGESVTFAYRFLIHKGDVNEARIAERFAAYAAMYQ